MKKIKSMHLVKEQEVIEEFNSTFDSIAESNLDPDNYTINNVCLFGRRESANGRIYSDTAIDSITRLSNGGKCFINHITKQEMKDRHGVRDLRDWVGVFESSRRDGEKVLSNLRIRENYWDLVKDIALMGPAGVGHSIDARIKVFHDENTGKESVVDVVDLRSTDLVASAATTQNLFESALDNNDNKSDEDLILKELAKYEVDEKVSSINIEEGILKNKMLEREINQLTWNAEDCIYDVMKDRDIAIAKKKKNIVGILDDLEKEINSRLAKLTKESKNKMDKTLEEIKEEIRQELRKEDEFKNAKDKNTTLEAKLTEATEKVTKLEEKLNGIKESNVELEKKNKEMAKELDEIKVVEAISKKKVVISQIIAEAKLPKEAVSDIFKDDLMSLEEKKDGDKIITFESQVKSRVEERKKLTADGIVTDNGDEFDETKESKKNTKKKEPKEALESFVSALK